MTTLVTGANGFIGGALVEKLVSRGEKVRALVRRTSNTDKLEALGVEITYGDLRDRESLEAALDGCECLYHVAAMFKTWAPDRRLFYDVNVAGTRNLLEVAMETGVKRVVYTSTVGTLVPELGGVVTEEPPSKRRFLGDYAESKILAEQEAFKLWERGLPLVSVHPTIVYGPGSMGSASNRALLRFLSGRMPGIPSVHSDMVFIDDVVQGHLLAFEKGREGGRYLLAGERVEMAQAMQLASRPRWSANQGA